MKIATNYDAWMRVIPVTLPLVRITRVHRVALAVLFVAALALWTWKLLEPHPVPESLVGGLESLSDSLPFLLAKTLHLSGYAFLAVLGGVFIPKRPGKLAAFLLLFLHGIGTEFGQTYVPNRHGCVRDVIIDTVGILCGMWLTQRYWLTSGISDEQERALLGRFLFSPGDCRESN